MYLEFAECAKECEISIMSRCACRKHVESNFAATLKHQNTQKRSEKYIMFHNSLSQILNFDADHSVCAPTVLQPVRELFSIVL